MEVIYSGPEHDCDSGDDNTQWAGIEEMCSRQVCVELKHFHISLY